MTDRHSDRRDITAHDPGKPDRGDLETEVVPPSCASPLARWKSPTDDQEYVFVPPGKTEIGAGHSDEDADENERPRHIVRVVRGFWMARAPVTVGAYKRYCDDAGREMPMAPDSNINWERKECPIVNLTREEALGYCRWAGARLPAEAEWEYAARAGSPSRYWWGDEMDDSMVWYLRNSGGQAHPVATKPANPWGLFDMLGNVWEWCADPWHTSYRGAPSEAVVWLGQQDAFTLRGGSWLNDAKGVRVSYRAAFPDVVGVPYCGFRCVRDAKPCQEKLS